MHAAIRILKKEHRTLAAVIHGLLHHTREISQGRTIANFALLRAMVYYIREYPEKFHHPKENALLFARMSPRAGKHRELVQLLEQQHHEGAIRLDRLDRALSRYEAERSPEAFAAFSSELNSYAEFQWEHMRAEEDDLLPLAESALNDAEWAEINRGFESHADPLTGVPLDETEDEFRTLYRRILELAPPPLGFGVASQHGWRAPSPL